MVENYRTEQSTEYRVGPETTQGELDQIAGKLMYFVEQEGHGHTFANLYLRSSNPVISEARRHDDKILYFYVEGAGWIYVSHAKVVVWND